MIRLKNDDEIAGIRKSCHLLADMFNYLIKHGIEKSTAFDIVDFVRKGKASKDPESWKGHVETMEKAGIESWFIESNGDPWGEFHIFISTWDEKCWTPYEKAIIEKYPKSNGFNQINKDNRVRYQTPAIKSSQFGEKYIDEIIGKLIEYYQFVEDLASKIRQRQ